MKKGWKRVLACVLALTLFAGYLPTKMNQVVNAEESNSQQETNLKFGDTDTYLQLSNPLSAAPQAIEATVNMPEIESEWTLCAPQNISVKNATKNEISEVENTVIVGPKTGTSYQSITMPSKIEFVFERKFNDVQVPYTWTNGDMALAFWVHSDKAVTLNKGNIELTSSGTCDRNEIDWPFSLHNVSLKVGWNYVEIPLGSMRSTAGNFDLQELNYLRWHSTYFEEETTIGLTDLKLIVLDGEENYGNYTDGEWTLADVNGTIPIDAIGQNSASKPETAGKVLELDVVKSQDCINQNFVSSMTIPSSYKLTGENQKNVSGDDADNLCVDFWIYTPEASFKAWFRFHQNNTTILQYNLANQTIQPGWNHIQIPLKELIYQPTSSSSDFSKLNRVTITAHGAAVEGTYYISDIRIIDTDILKVKDYVDGEWTLAEIGDTDVNDSVVANAENGPETGNNILEIKVVKSQDCINQNFVSSMTIPSSYKLTGENQKNVSGDDADNLCVDFWIYTPEASFKAWFRFHQNNTTILQYNLANQTIQPGWNHIQIPLKELIYQPTSSSSDFSKLNRVTITAHGAAVEGTYYISDIRIIDTDIYNLVDESIYNATALNYMVFSNLNATSEDNQTALFVTKTGNPAFVWGNQQYTLNKNVCTGKDVKIKVVRAAGDKIQFYINEKLIETCVTNTTDLNAPTTAHCIGGDAAGKQIMNGSISNLKVYSDATLSTCIGNWELTGNIQNVTGTIKDSSTYANTAVFRGSRADDWSDYQVPEDIKNEIGTLVSAHSFGIDGKESFNEVTNVKEGAHAQTIDYKRQTAIYKTNHYRIDYTKDGLSFDLSTYNLDDLAVEFWMKSSNTETTKLSEKSFLEFRNSKKDAIIFKGTAITLQSGEWTKITLPLKDATTKTIKDDKIIKKVRLLVRDIHENEDIYVSDMKIVKVEQNPWSLVYIPDMENLTANDSYNKTWLEMAQWIADNAETENIQHVIGGGDTTKSNSGDEYNCAMEGYQLFMNDVSWSTMVGLNDYAEDYTKRDASQYHTTFGESVIKASAASETYKGSYVDAENKSTTENSYYRFNVNGVKWMILQLEYAPREEVLEWADGIIKEHPLDNVILATPGYLNGYGAKLKIGETVWNKLSGNQNIKMILCGHSTNGTGAIAQATEKYSGDSGDTGSVPVLMMNAQDLDAGADAYYTDRPLGMISILRFSADGKNVAVQYYSPTEGKSFSPDDNFGKANSNSITFEIDTEVCTPIITPYGEEYGTPFAAATAPDNIPDGYIFAGWFTDEACTTALKANDNAEQAYAKFVDAEVLSVKAQVRLDEIKDDDDKVTGYKLPEDKTDMRFVTTVDSTKYREVGFEITAKDSTGQDKTIKVGSEFVYEYLYAVGKVGTEGAEPMSYTPSDICSPQSTLFKTFTVTDIPVAKYGETFSVRAYWITQDGTTVYGYEEPVTKTVYEGAK